MASALTHLHNAATAVIYALEGGKHEDLSDAQKQVVVTAGLDLIAVLGCIDVNLDEAGGSP